MPVLAGTAAALVAIGSMFAWLTSAPVPFSPHACANVERYLPAHVVGQELALRQLADAVCTHVARHQQQQHQPLLGLGENDPLAAGGGDDDHADDGGHPRTTESHNLARRAFSGLVSGGQRAASAVGGWVSAPSWGAAGHKKGSRRRRRRSGQQRQQQHQQHLAPPSVPDASRQHNSKPLVISVHGPPGVGKTLTHTLLARAIYGRGDPVLEAGAGRGSGGGGGARGPESLGPQDLCPGRACRGYRVFYGMDYLSSERAQRIEALRADLLSHLRRHADAVVVVEEYDKLSCEARSMWRHLLQRPQDANASALARAVVLLESNLGMSELEGMLTGGGLGTGGQDEGQDGLAVAAGGQGGGGEEEEAAAAAAAAVARARGRASAEEAERRLRDAVFARWRRDGCEPYEDTLKLVSLVDFFLPYFPLERRHVDELISRALRERARGFFASTAAAAVDEEEDEGEKSESGVEVGGRARDEAEAWVAADVGGRPSEAGHGGGIFWPPPPPCAPPASGGGGGSSGGGLRLAWRPSVVRFLSSRVEFSGPFPLEGAKGVESAVTRHVARLLRRAAEALAAQRRARRRSAALAGAGPAATPTGRQRPPPLPTLPLPDTLLLFAAPASSGSAVQELKAELMTSEKARARMAREAEEEDEEEGEETKGEEARPAAADGACAAIAGDCAAATTS